MGRENAAAPSRQSRVIRSSVLFAIAILILFAIPALAAADPITIDVTDDANQSPVFTTFTDPLLTDPGAWNEFQYEGRAYPVLGGHTSNKSLPVVHISANIPNGQYWVYANLYGQPTTSYRYYYSYRPANPSQYSVDIGPQADCAESALLPITVSDGKFDLYLQKADVTSGPETYFAWAWVRLVPVYPPTSSPASSAWSLWLLGGVGAVVAVFGIRRLTA